MMHPAWATYVAFLFGIVVGGIFAYNAGWECRGIEERKRRFMNGSND